MDSFIDEIPDEEEEEELEDEKEEEEQEEDIEEIEEEEEDAPIAERRSESRIVYKLIPKDSYMSSNIMTHNEATEAIGIRASQIENGAPVFVDAAHLTDPIAQARFEFMERKNPLKLRRKMREEDNIVYYEEFKVRKMSYPNNLFSPAEIDRWMLR